MWKNSTRQEFGFPDYGKYRFTFPEMILYLVEGCGLIVLIGKCFYDSYLAMIILLPSIVLFFRWKKRELNEQRKLLLRTQFKDMVLAVLANQKAGYSVEKAFVEAKKDMEMLYGKKCDMYLELGYIEKGLQNNMTLENLLLSLGERSGVSDIQDFAEIFYIAKRSGGNIASIIRTTVQMIEDKLEVDQEIQVALNAKKMEVSVMCCIPFFMILYLDITSPGFFDCMYHNLFGIIIMTICLISCCFAFLLSRKIVSIEIR